MEVILSRCAGRDVHKRTVVACIRRLEPDDQINQEVRTFGTMTADLLSLADWLAACGVTQIAMESTGVYWKPVSNLLEARSRSSSSTCSTSSRSPAARPT